MAPLNSVSSGHYVRRTAPVWTCLRIPLSPACGPSRSLHQAERPHTKEHELLVSQNSFLVSSTFSPLRSLMGACCSRGLLVPAPAQPHLGRKSHTLKTASRAPWAPEPGTLRPAQSGAGLLWQQLGVRQQQPPSFCAFLRVETPASYWSVAYTMQLGSATHLDPTCGLWIWAGLHYSDEAPSRCWGAPPSMGSPPGLSLTLSL